MGIVRTASSLFFFACAALSAFAYYDRYYKWRDCFNELGRCFDPETVTVYTEGAGMVWTLFFIITIIPALILWFKRPKPKP